MAHLFRKFNILLRFSVTMLSVWVIHIFQVQRSGEDQQIWGRKCLHFKIIKLLHICKICSIVRVIIDLTCGVNHLNFILYTSVRRYYLQSSIEPINLRIISAFVDWNYHRLNALARLTTGYELWVQATNYIIYLDKFCDNGKNEPCISLPNK